jgi:hypothetical protein
MACIWTSRCWHGIYDTGRRAGMTDLSRKAGSSQTVSNHWVMVAWTSRCCSIRRGFHLNYVFEVLLMHPPLSRSVTEPSRHARLWMLSESNMTEFGVSPRSYLVQTFRQLPIYQRLFATSCSSHLGCTWAFSQYFPSQWLR